MSNIQKLKDGIKRLGEFEKHELGSQIKRRKCDQANSAHKELLDLIAITTCKDIDQLADDIGLEFGIVIPEDIGAVFGAAQDNGDAPKAAVKDSFVLKSLIDASKKMGAIKALRAIIQSGKIDGHSSEISLGDCKALIDKLASEAVEITLKDPNPEDLNVFVTEMKQFCEVQA